jgi:hypothetical protein
MRPHNLSLRRRTRQRLLQPGLRKRGRRNRLRLRAPGLPRRGLNRFLSKRKQPGGLMQTRLKEELDADRFENYSGVTEYKTEKNRHEINCGVCCKMFYADQETYESISRAVEQGLDNPYLCEDCRQEYEEMAFERR